MWMMMVVNMMKMMMMMMMMMHFLSHCPVDEPSLSHLSLPHLSLSLSLSIYFSLSPSLSHLSLSLYLFLSPSLCLCSLCLSVCQVFGSCWSHVVLLWLQVLSHKMEYKKNCDTLSEKNSFDAEGNAYVFLTALLNIVTRILFMS